MKCVTVQVVTAQKSYLALTNLRKHIARNNNNKKNQNLSEVWQSRKKTINGSNGRKKSLYIVKLMC